MAARAIVTRYGTESVLPNGNISIEWWAIVIDPAVLQGVQPGVILSELVELDAAAPAGWATTVENSVIAAAASLASPYTLTAATVFIPTIA